MNNDWIQINRASGTVEVINMRIVYFMLKNGPLRRINLSTDRPNIELEVSDTVQSKTNAEVETFLGAPFAKIIRGNETFYIPMTAIEHIEKIGSEIKIGLGKHLDLYTAITESELGTEF